EAEPPRPFGVAVGRATALLSRDLMVRAIFVTSRSGQSAVEVCGERPAAPVVVLTSDPAVRRSVLLLWGVIPVLREEAELDDPSPCIREVSQELGLAEPGQTVLLVRGFSADPDNNRPSMTLVPI
ncbi:MAG: pyruvate kinase alpha/beta domain-containing protein, partial [Xanthomonadales bacterium]|nr:pyruvate kinase alpha/beta domain-containing protein [Xanthomonadales bacterium]